GDAVISLSILRHVDASAEERAAYLKRAGVDVTQDRERDHRIALGERDATYAHGIPALEHPHVADREPDALSLRAGQQHVVPFGADLHVDDRLALVELHG